MFALTTKGAQIMATIPDVCLTPAPPSPSPVPIPYPNIGSSQMANPATIVEGVLIVALPALNKNSSILVSSGDEAGSAGGGVASHMIKGEIKFVKGSMKVMIGGKPAVRLSDLTTHNKQNAMGAALAPSQTTVMVMG